MIDELLTVEKREEGKDIHNMTKSQLINYAKSIKFPIRKNSIKSQILQEIKSFLDAKDIWNRIINS